MFLASCYRYGRWVEKDTKEMIKWTRLALDGTDNDDEQYYLGRYYFNGQYVEKNYDEAIKWFRFSARLGNAYAQYHLGLCYEEGYGVDRNRLIAMNYYKQAAAQDHREAKESLRRLNSEMYNNNPWEDSYFNIDY